MKQSLKWLKRATLVATVFYLPVVCVADSANTAQPATPELVKPSPQQDRFDILPAGAIQARGWTARMLAEDAAGWVKTTSEISKNPDNKATDLFPTPRLYDPLIRADKSRNSKRAAGGCIQGYWLYAVFNYGWIGGLEEYQRIGRDCMEEILSACDRDGYIGYYDTKLDSIEKDGYALNGLGEILTACLHYYELTGDERVLAACKKSADHYLARPINVDKQGWSITFNQFYAQLYLLTKNSAYLAYADHLYFAKKADTTTLNDPWAKGQVKRLNKKHSAGTALYLAAMLDLYRASGKARWLEGICNIDEAVRHQYVDATGAPCSTSELLDGNVDVSQAHHELCASCLWMFFWGKMTGVTGKAMYGDYSEKVFFNQIQAARDKDGKAVCYFNSPNWYDDRSGGKDEPVGAAVKHAGAKARYCYDTVWECCSGNSSRALLNWLGTAAFVNAERKELVLQAYAPYTLQVSLAGVGKVGLTLDTDYPFKETIRIKLNQVENTGPFTLLLRHPGWCTKPVIAVNGERLATSTDQNGFIRVDRVWKTGDSADLTLPMALTPSASVSQSGRVAVEYGPFLLSHPIPSERRELAPNIYQAYRGKNSFWEFAGGRMDMARGDASNRDLIFNFDAANPAATLSRTDVLDSDKNAHVWDVSPFEFKVNAVHRGDTKPVATKLVPIGFTRLRETYLQVNRRID